MARQYMTDGQFEEYCRRQAEAMNATLEVIVPRMLERIVSFTSSCPECGALVVAKDRHEKWHTTLWTDPTDAD